MSGCGPAEQSDFELSCVGHDADSGTHGHPEETRQPRPTRASLPGDPHRQITYTAVKNRITALRAGLDARPTTGGDILGGVVASPAGVGAPGCRDTSRAHLAGAGAFSLDVLRSAGDTAEGDR